MSRLPIVLVWVATIFFQEKKFREGVAVLKKLIETYPNNEELRMRVIEICIEALKENPDMILLDNMSNALIKEALVLVPEEIETEASGNMRIDRVRVVAELGVDFISVGAITHSAPVSDVSLLFDWQESEMAEI